MPRKNIPINTYLCSWPRVDSQWINEFELRNCFPSTCMPHRPYRAQESDALRLRDGGACMCVVESGIHQRPASHPSVLGSYFTRVGGIFRVVHNGKQYCAAYMYLKLSKTRYSCVCQTQHRCVLRTNAGRGNRDGPPASTVGDRSQGRSRTSTSKLLPDHFSCLHSGTHTLSHSCIPWTY